MLKRKAQKVSGGVSHSVRQTIFVHPSQRLQGLYPSSRNVSATKITRVLDPLTREKEVQESDILMKEQLKSIFLSCFLLQVL